MTDNHTPHKASDYDNEIVRTIPYYSFFHTESIHLARTVNHAPEKWLDTGCGTGLLVEKARNEFPDCSFLLVDPSADMLGICEEKFKNDSKIRILGTYPTVSIERKYKTDIITAIQCHHYMHFDERLRTTEHCYSLLNKNGLYITFENIKPDTIDGTKIGLKHWGEYQKTQARTSAQIAAHLARFGKKYFPISISEHIDILKKSGFKTAELFWLSGMQAGFYGIKE